LHTDATGLQLDQCGNLYVSNNLNQTILKYSLSDMQKPVIIAGTGQAGGTSTQLHNPQGITFDIDFNLYVSDYGYIHHVFLWEFSGSNSQSDTPVGRIPS
ncbi:unnamed protein product, partial [Adineta ricciae]